jgi:hypothetical protein
MIKFTGTTIFFFTEKKEEEEEEEEVLQMFNCVIEPKFPSLCIS